MANNITLSLHVKAFNEKVKLMNQTGKQSLILSAQEARNLHSDIFDLLTQFAKMSKQSNSDENQVVNVQMDGGTW